MTEIVLASNNRKKIAELETLIASLSSNKAECGEKASEFSEIKVKTLADIGYTTPIEETGTTFEENSLIKAETPAKLGYIGIADDSGLTVDYLNGAPGVYSARYAGEDADDEKNKSKLLRELENVPYEKRGGAFVCTVSLVLPEKCGIVIPNEWRITSALSEKSGIPSERAMVVRGECRGFILEREHGNGGFGYDPLFYYPEFGETFAAVDRDKKNSVSHRGKAMSIFIPRLLALFN